MMLRSLILVITCLLVMQPVMASKRDSITIIINADGTVATPEGFRLKAKNMERIGFDVSELKSWDSAAKNRAKSSLNQNFAAAMDFLEDSLHNSKLLNFYHSYFDSLHYSNLDSFVVDHLIADMKTIKEKLGSTKYKPTDASSWKGKLLAPLDSIIDSMLNLSYYKVVQQSTPSKIDIKVYKTDPYNAILAAYYNKIMQLPENRAIKYNASIAEMDALADSAARVQQLMASINSGEFSIELLNQIYDVYDQKETKLEQYGRAPWFIQWFWKTGGVINTTPLGFTDDQKVRYPVGSVDTGSKRRFTDFLDAATKKFIADTNARDVMAYKHEVLDYYNKEILFFDSSLIKERAGINRQIRNKFLGYKEFATHLQLRSPHDHKTWEYLYFSADDPPQGQQQLRSLTTNDHVSVTVFNVPKGQTADVVLVSAKVIEDQSTVTAGLSTSFETLGEALATAAPLAGTVRGLLAGYSHKQQLVNRQIDLEKLEKDTGAVMGFEDVVATRKGNKIMIANITLKPFPVQMQRSSVFWQEIRKILKKQHDAIIDSNKNNFAKIPTVRGVQFSEAYFEKMKNDLKYRNKDLTIDSNISMIIADYTTHIVNDIIAPKVVLAVREEFTKRDHHLAQLISIVRTSSAPMEMVIPIEPVNASFTTMLKEIAVKDSATDREYEVITTTTTADGKSTNKILTSFSYKTGKRFWVQPSLGAAYNFHSIRRNSVTEQDGQLLVETNTQQLSAVVALHFYPFYGGLFLQDRKFYGEGCRNVVSRINIMLGLDFLNIPDNLFLGIGYDLGPGLKINTGVQLYKYTYYEVRNDVVVSEQQTYRAAYPFIYIGIDPVVAAKGIAGIFK